jgi:hypothetical protein
MNIYRYLYLLLERIIFLYNLKMAVILIFILLINHLMRFKDHHLVNEY